MTSCRPCLKVLEKMLGMSEAECFVFTVAAHKKYLLRQHLS